VDDPTAEPIDARDPLGLAAHAPLLAAYLAALDRRGAGEHAFCTPGHKGLTADRLGGRR
jgi:hypothetical protein